MAGVPNYHLGVRKILPPWSIPARSNSPPPPGMLAPGELPPGQILSPGKFPPGEFPPGSGLGLGNFIGGNSPGGNLARW